MVEALEEVLVNYGTSEIFNNNQGCQLTSHDLTGELQAHGIKISIDGRGP